MDKSGWGHFSFFLKNARGFLKKSGARTLRAGRTRTSRQTLRQTLRPGDFPDNIFAENPQDIFPNNPTIGIDCLENRSQGSNLFSKKNPGKSFGKVPRQFSPKCAFNAPSMRLQCAFNASSMRLQCVFNASSMRLQCAFNAPSMRLQCV